MKRLFTAALTTALILGLAATASAQRKKSKPEEPKKKTEEVKLTDDQKEKLGAIRRQAAKERIRLGAEKKIASLELHEMLQSNQPNQAMVDRKIEQLAQLNGQLTKNRLQSGIATRSVLTKEQRQAMRHKIGKRMTLRRHQRMEMRHPGVQKKIKLRFHRGGPMSLAPGEPLKDSEEMGLEPEEFEEEWEGTGPGWFGSTEETEPADDENLIPEGDWQ